MMIILLLLLLLTLVVSIEQFRQTARKGHKFDDLLSRLIELENTQRLILLCMKSNKSPYLDGPSLDVLPNVDCLDMKVRVESEILLDVHHIVS